MPRDSLQEEAVIVQLAVAHIIETAVVPAMRVKPGVSSAPEAED